MLADITFVCLSMLAAICFRIDPNAGPWPSGLGVLFQTVTIRDYLGFLLVYPVLVTLYMERNHLYQALTLRSAREEIQAVCRAVFGATLIVIAGFFFLHLNGSLRFVIVASGLLSVVTLAGWRLGRRAVVKRSVEKGHGLRNVLIIGTGKVGQSLSWYLESHKHLGYVVKGFLDQNPTRDPRLLGTIEDFGQIARALFIDEVFITIPSQRQVVKQVAQQAGRSRVSVRVAAELFDGLGPRAPIEYLGDIPVMDLHREPIPVLGLLGKRLIDVIVSAITLMVFSPLMAAIALVVKLASPGPVFYPSRRVGKKGRPFLCYKFRTMVNGADDQIGQLQHLNQRTGPLFKIADDPRVTRFGSFLRAYSLDELPQFWNVLKGDMSLVGPRPGLVSEYEHYNVDWLRRLDVTPGLTGLWQINARRDPRFESYLAYDLEYLEHWSVWLDLKILARTIPVVLAGTGE